MAAAAPNVVDRFFSADSRFPKEMLAWQPEGEHSLNMYLAWQKTPPMLLRPILEGTDLLHAAEIAGFLAALLLLLRECRRTSRLI
jgi:hypothetical protein